MLFSVISSVVLAVVVALTAATAMQLIANDGQLAMTIRQTAGPNGATIAVKRFTGLDKVGDGWPWAIGLGAVVGAVNFLAPITAASAFSVLTVVYLPVMIGLNVLLMYWWKKEGGRMSEMVPFIIMAVLFAFVTASSAVAMAGALKANVFWISVLNIVPWLLLTAVIGFMLIDLLYFRYREIDSKDSNEAKRDLAWGRALIAITTLILGFLLFTGVAWGQMGNAFKAGVANASGSAEWYKFYNSDLQNDGDDSNDFNFGPNPYADGKTAKDYDADFRERLKWDPALAAASTAWLDANVGTRYLGEFYESCKGDWAKTMNDAKIRFMNDQSAYYKNLDAYFAFLDSAVKVEVRDCKSVSDQMYMNPHTSDKVPDVIVLLTDDHSGHELVYTFMIKGDTFEVAYRIECGYQPTDVAEKMGITPQNQATYVPGSGNPGGTNPPGTNSPGTNPPGTNPPGDNPPSGDEPKKDPSKLTPINTEPNDNTGPGERTIGDDPNHSTKDRPDNSTSYPSYDAYRNDMDHLADVNNNQRVGGDSNQPSTETPSGTNVDNNGANGTGYGGADVPTPISQPATPTDGSAVTKPGGDGAWGNGTPPA